MKAINVDNVIWCIAFFVNKTSISDESENVAISSSPQKKV